VATLAVMPELMLTAVCCTTCCRTCSANAAEPGFKQHWWHQCRQRCFGDAMPAAKNTTTHCCLPLEQPSSPCYHHMYVNAFKAPGAGCSDGVPHPLPARCSTDGSTVFIVPS
jgi:hypothetical protein